MKFLGALLVLAVNLSAYADISESECSTKDFSERFGPVKDQGHSNFCYSFAASDLLAEGMGVSPAQQISALQVASQYVSMSQEEVAAANDAIAFETPQMVLGYGGMGGGVGGSGGGAPPVSKNPFINVHDPRGKPFLKREGGETDLILAHMLLQPKVCLESEAPSQLPGISYSDPRQQGYFSVELGTRAGGPDIQAFMNHRSNPDAVGECTHYDPALDAITGTTEDVKYAIQEYAANRVRREITPLCSVPMNQKLKVHTRSFLWGTPDTERVKQYAMEVLNKDRPFALHYNACALTTCTEGQYNYHSSTVVGRSWNRERGQCQLKIRNSWGTSCENKRPNVDCDNGIWTVDLNEVTQGNTEIIWIDK